MLERALPPLRTIFMPSLEELLFMLSKARYFELIGKANGGTS